MAGPEPGLTRALTEIGRMQFGVELICPGFSARALERAIASASLRAVQRGGLGAGSGDARAMPSPGDRSVAAS